MSTGIKDGRTLLRRNDSMPSFVHCRGNTLSQSIRLEITVNFLEFLEIKLNKFQRLHISPGLLIIMNHRVETIFIRRA